MVTRTLGPLHLEDLEPHRFEDLVRFLLYDFRDWRALEPTGRSGADDGFDIRGWEKTTGGGDDGAADRLWMIQCKRVNKLGPSDVANIVRELLSAGTIPYGIILAVAAVLSKQSRDAFRQEAIGLGVKETYLLDRQDLEGMLFQKKNDHILFAFTGLSLSPRPRINDYAPYRRSLERVIAYIAEASRVRVQDIGLHVWLPTTPSPGLPSALERVARLRLSDATASKARLWGYGEGAVGQCWKEHDDFTIDLTQPELLSDGENWQELPESLTLRLTREEMARSVAMFKAICVCPVIPDEDFMGCISLNFDRNCPGHFNDLWCEQTKLLLHNAAISIGDELRWQEHYSGLNRRA